MNSAIENHAVPEAAFLLGYHRLTPNDMAAKQKLLIDDQPKFKFAALQAGVVYAYRNYGGGCNIVVVEKITPSGKQADLRVYGSERSERAFAGSYAYDFIEMNDLLLSFIGVTHEMIVTKAVKRGFYVPPLVRRYHPQLFVDIPERFTMTRGEWPQIQRSPGKRVANALHPYMSFKVIGPEQIQAILDTANDKFARFLDLGMKQKALNPSVESYYDKAAADFQDTVDFYTWLLPHVLPGGAFYVAPSDTG